MHEWGLVADAIGELESHEAGLPPRRVTLRLGPGADDDTVRAAWEQLTASGPLRESELVVEHDEDLLRCLDCGIEYRGQLPEPCPDCHGDGLVVTRAADLTVCGSPAGGPERSERPGSASSGGSS
jgi:Zn finger protein HypA/HybF involved in hydrogenase expression